MSNLILYINIKNQNITIGANKMDYVKLSIRDYGKLVEIERIHKLYNISEERIKRLQEIEHNHTKESLCYRVRMGTFFNKEYLTFFKRDDVIKEIGDERDLLKIETDAIKSLSLWQFFQYKRNKKRLNL